MTSPAGVPHGSLELTREELLHWGQRFGTALTAPAVVAISGELGAGKTTLVQSICAALGVTDPVTSPTFALVHSYRGAGMPVYHLDLYRLDSPADLTQIGWEEILGSRAVVFVEWPDRAGSALPSDATQLALWHIPGVPDQRWLSW